MTRLSVLLGTALFAAMLMASDRPGGGIDAAADSALRSGLIGMSP
ncbi:hypothetical protein [Anianabacter salinae]|nr:hypothetical protein [Anianabacter salinae]